MEQQVTALLAEIFQLPAETIPPDLALGRIPQWDSMGHMGLMLALEERFGVEVNADTIGALTSLPAILNYLTEKQRG
jgi:citrate synthase